MRAFALALVVLLSGCASHHIGDCASCLGVVIVHDRVADNAQTQTIYGEVSKAFKSQAAQNAAAHKSLAPASVRAAAGLAPIGGASVAPVESSS